MDVETAPLGEEDFRLVAESIPHIAWVAEPNGETGHLNLIGRRYFGDPGEAASSWLQFVHPEDVDAGGVSWRHAVDSGEPVRLDCRIRRADGEYRMATFRSMPVRDPQGSVIRWLCTLVDVEESDIREKLLRSAKTERAEALALLSSIYTTAPVGLAFIDREYRFVLINEYAAQVMGMPAEDQLGLTVAEVAPEFWTQIKPALDRVLHDGVPVIDAETTGESAATPGRTTRWLTNYYPVQVEDEIVGVGVVSVDIADREQAHEAREVASRLLRETVQESYRLQQLANERLRALDVTKNDFILAVSHELRTPLAAILGFALTLQHHQEVDEAVRDDAVDRIAANARRLTTLIDSLLDLGRLTRGVIEPKREPTDLGVLFGRVASHTDMEGRALTVEGYGVEANLDVPMAERIVENLLANVVGHTPVGSSARLTGRYLGSGVLIQLYDDGPGVPDDAKAEIFGPFDRADPSVEHAPGLGIGLALVSRFASLHGGRVWVEDVEGGGSCFNVHLPSGPVA